MSYQNLAITFSVLCGFFITSAILTCWFVRGLNRSVDRVFHEHLATHADTGRRS